MAGADPSAIEYLSSPPISEVVCGFIFEPPKGLDSVLVGAYWSTRREDFPGRQVAPPIADAMLPFLAGVLPVRTLLVDEAEAFLLQIQPDRFYINWRRRDAEYPRFSDRPGRSPGILSRALEEFGRFQTFCEANLGQRPRPIRVELAKVDCLVQASHWRDLEDLSRMLPVVKPLTSLARGTEPQLTLQFLEDQPSGKLGISFALAKRSVENGSERVMNLETRLSAPATTNPRVDFERLNEELNRVFASLIPREERHARFGGQK